MRRRALLLGAAAFGVVGHVRANQRLTLLVGATAGSAVDTVARTFAPFLARHLPFTDVDVRNLPGGAGLATADAVAKAAPDGSVLGWVATPTLPARAVDRGAEDLLRRVALLGAVHKEPIAVVSPAASPLGSVQDIVARAAEDAEAVPFGTPPPGSPPHLAALRLQVLAQTRLNIVAFPSATAARQAVVAGNVAAAALTLSSAIGDLREGRLVGLGIAANNRSDVFPDMPPMKDSGLNLSANVRRGLAAPVRLPAELVARLGTAMQGVVADPEFRDQAAERGILAKWLDGAAWASAAAIERAELAQLWETEPWLQEGTG